LSNKLYRSSEDELNSLWGVNKHINNDSTEIPLDIQNNEIDENKDIFRGQQIKWHLSKLEGYVSDEFRNIKFAD